MPEDYQWLQQFHQQQEEARRQRELKNAQKRKEARQTLKKYSTGKNRSQAKSIMRRGTKNRANEAISMLKALTPWSIFSSILQFQPMTDWTYGIAFFAAILKDILDPFELTGFFYAFVFVITILASITIGLMMLLASLMEGKSNRVERKIIRAFLTLTLATTIEIIPGVNILPIETVTVLVLYAFALQDRKKEEAWEKLLKKADKQEELEQQELPEFA